MFHIPGLYIQSWGEEKKRGANTHQTPSSKKTSKSPASLPPSPPRSNPVSQHPQTSPRYTTPTSLSKPSLYLPPSSAPPRHPTNNPFQEILSLKLDIFSRLPALTPPDAILATNTSSLSITKLAAAAGPAAAHRVLSTHFMNPVPIQPGVEIITALQTSPETLSRALAFVTAMGKTPSTSRDTPGFIANRILMPYINEAVMCLETGVATRDDIDGIMKNGTGVPMGPLRLADFIGLDTCLAIMKVLADETGDSKYRPAVMLGRMVDAGWLGKKSGKGFYDY